MPPADNAPFFDKAVPLFVDLDGTLVRTDTTTESAFSLIRRNIAYLFVLPFWLLRGQAYLKARVAALEPLKVAELPYRRELIAFLREQRAEGRQLSLATAANRHHAQQVAAYLGLFEAVLASDEAVNLEGHAKLARMAETAGPAGFDYAADDLADMAIFPHARRAIVVAPPRPLRKAMGTLTNVERVFDPEARPLINTLWAARPARWLMNLLILLPLLWAGSAGAAWHLALWAIATFSLAASGNYIFDDLLHLAERRRLPAKHRGVVASGQVALQRAGMAVGFFWLLAFVSTLFLSLHFALAMAGYVLLSVLAVQDWFKCPRPIVAMVLGFSRIAAGAALTGQPLALVPCLVGLAAGALVEAVRRPKLGLV